MLDSVKFVVLVKRRVCICLQVFVALFIDCLLFGDSGSICSLFVTSMQVNRVFAAMQISTQMCIAGG